MERAVRFDVIDKGLRGLVWCNGGNSCSACGLRFKCWTVRGGDYITVTPQEHDKWIAPHFSPVGRIYLGA